MGLPLFGGKDETTDPANSNTNDASQRPQRSKTPTQRRGRSKTRAAAAAGTKTAAPTTRQKVMSKAAMQHHETMQRTQPKDPDGGLERMDSTVFHASFSSSEDDGNNSCNNNSPPLTSTSKNSPIRVRRPVSLDKTWSISAFSCHSTGEASAQVSLYVEEDDESDFDTDDEADKVMNRNGKKKKATKKGRRPGGHAPRRMTKKQRKKEKEAEAAAEAEAGAANEEKEAAETAFLTNEAIPAETLSIDVIEENKEEDDDNDDKSSEYEVLKLYSPSKAISSTENGMDGHESGMTTLMDSVSSRDDFESLVSACSYKVPAFVGMSRVTALNDGAEKPALSAGGYTSDSALCRRRLEARQHEERQREKEVKKRKNKKKKKGKEHKLSKQEKMFPLVIESNELAVDYGYDDVEEASPKTPHRKALRRYSTGAFALLDGVAIKKKRADRSPSRRRSKKDKKKKKRKGKKSSGHTTSEDDLNEDDDEDIYLPDDRQGDNALPLSQMDNVDQEVPPGLEEMDRCFKDVDEKAGEASVFDKRVSGVEHSKSILEERELLRKERETIAFERESLELQLNDEIQKSESLTLRVRELEQQLQSQQFSQKGNNAELANAIVELKSKFERELSDLKRNLLEKETEIENLKHCTKDTELLEEKEHVSPEITDGKSRERLKGELLQTVSKLAEKEAILDRQTEELSAVRKELTALQDGSGVPELKNEILSLKKETKDLSEELNTVRKESSQKLKEKDETITFLMGELARLKQEQSVVTKQLGVACHPPNNSFWK